MAQASIQIREDEGFALVTVSGEVHGNDFVEAAHALHRHPGWHRDLNVIWDARAITTLIINPDDLPGIVEAKLEKSAGTEVTVAVRELDKEIAALCALLLRIRGRDAIVVETLEEALAEVSAARGPDASV